MKKNNKKGISPLIATVIVIGFTIVLAALVITWGTRLFKTTVSDTETASKFNLACTTGMKLEITKKNPQPSTSTTNDITFVMMNNNQDQPIDNFVGVAKCKSGNVVTASITTTTTGQLTFPIPRDYRATYSCLTVGAESIDFYPQLTISGQTRKCENPINVKA